MHAHRTRKSWFALLVPLLFAVGACEEDATGPDGLAFQPDESAASLDSVVTSLEGEDDYFDGFALAETALVGEAGPTSASYTIGAMRRVVPVDGTMHHGFDHHTGQTYVYDPAANQGEGGYVADAEQTGAPANGVRFLYYAIDPVDHEPVEPLIELGYIDLTDETPDGATDRRVLGIKVVDTASEPDVSLVDYTIDVSRTTSGTGKTLDWLAEGFVSTDGVDLINFTLDKVATYTEGSETVDVVATYSFERSSQEISVVGTADGLFDKQGHAVEGEHAMTITKGENEAMYSLALDAAGALSGSITHNGVEVIVLGGTRTEPEFTRPDGSAIGQAERVALHRLHEGYRDVRNLAHRIFHAFRRVHGLAT